MDNLNISIIDGFDFHAKLATALIENGVFLAVYAKQYLRLKSAIKFDTFSTWK